VIPLRIAYHIGATYAEAPPPAASAKIEWFAIDAPLGLNGAVPTYRLDFDLAHSSLFAYR
jgi:hypothetical protein